MRIVKPNQLSLVTRSFEYRESAFLGFSIIAGLPMMRAEEFLFEADLWKQVTPLLGESGVLDAGIPKSRAEFLVSGAAYSGSDGPVGAMRVSVAVGSVKKELLVFGDRFFDGDELTDPVPFERMPIDWRHAFGGEKFAPNPHGKGIGRILSGPEKGRLALPNVEHPDRLLRLKSQRPHPASLGATEMAWPSRLALAGTYDEHWLKTAFPGFPADIRWEYFNIAQADQWSKEPWQGGEPFRIVGMHADAPVIEGQVPEFSARCFFRMQGESDLQEARTVLTTLWFFPDIDLLVPIYQGSIRVAEDDAQDVDTLLIAAERPDEKRTTEHYAQTLELRTSPDASLFDLIRDAPLMPAGLARSLASDIMAGLDGSMETPLVSNLRSSLDQAIAELKEKTSELGHQFPDDQVPKWPVETEMPAVEELDQFFEQKMRDLEDALEQASAREEEARAMVKDELSKRPDFNLSLEELESNSDKHGPPGFSAEGIMQQIRESCEQVRAIGSDPSEMEAMLNDPAQLAFWQEAEAGLNDLYRMAAHYQQPVARPGDDGSRLASLRELLAQGKPVVDKDFSGLDLSNQDFSNQDLSGIFLESANLKDANLTGARLDRAVLAHADLEGCRLDGASLKGANLGKSRIIEVSARGSCLDDAILGGAEIRNSDFAEATISGMQTFFQAELDQCCFAGVTGHELVFLDLKLAGCDFSGCTLTDTVFINCDLAQTRWDDANIDELPFVSCTARNASFARASLVKVMLAKDCDFSGSDFTGACLDQANLRDARLMNCQFVNASLDAADLSNVTAGGSSFRLASAAESRWVRADLRDADMAGINLSQGVLHKADLRGADLHQANLHAADLARVFVDRSTCFEGALTTRMNTYPRRFGRENVADA